MQSIRVLSVRQPYADQIIHGDKWAELRTWKTPYRGPVYIHASRWDGSPSQGSPGPGQTGAIIGRVKLVDCVSEEDLLAISMNAGKRRNRLPASLGRLADVLSAASVSWDHGIGEWNWIVLDPQPLIVPIPALGKLNLWNAEFLPQSLGCGGVTPDCGRPAASDYPNISSKEVEFVPVARPDGWVANLLFDVLEKAGPEGHQMTQRRLRELASVWEREVDHLERILTSSPQFERVPGKPERGQWWRIRQGEMEYRRGSNVRKPRS